MRRLLDEGAPIDEKDLLAWLLRLRPHGTLVLIYNLWETEDGQPELALFSSLDDIKTNGGVFWEKVKEFSLTSSRLPSQFYHSCFSDVKIYLQGSFWVDFSSLFCFYLLL